MHRLILGAHMHSDNFKNVQLYRLIATGHIVCLAWGDEAEWHALMMT